VEAVEARSILTTSHNQGGDEIEEGTFETATYFNVVVALC
jgi:hypothetical protein